MIQVKLQAGIVAGCAEGCEAGSKHLNKCSSAYSFMEGSSAYKGSPFLLRSMAARSLSRVRVVDGIDDSPNQPQAWTALYPR